MSAMEYNKGVGGENEQEQDNVVEGDSREDSTLSRNCMK